MRVKNRWNETEFSCCKTLLEQRVYCSRLLGQDPELVLHGGGNTSVKDEITNLFGEKERILYIKGSGWDLASIQANGFPAIKIDPLLRLRRLNELSDPDMMNELRTHLVDSSSPDPSVEAFLHAFLPHRFVDHTHSDAILTLTNQRDGENLIRNLHGKRVGIVPYIMPGFKLFKLCGEIFDGDPSVEGLILLRHGIFTFGGTAKQSYDRMISLVRQAEEYILSKKKSARIPQTRSEYEDVKTHWMQAIRKELLARRFACIVALNDSKTSIEFVSHPELARISQIGPLTPDHVIHTKRLPLCIPADVVLSKDFVYLGRLFDDYQAEYQKYFERNGGEKAGKIQMLDPCPRVLLLPGIGIVASGGTRRDAEIALDMYTHTAAAIFNAEQMTGYQSIPESDIFDVEYWVLEQAKLKLGPKKSPLSGKIAAVTGGAGGIGLAISRKLLEQGALVYIIDLNEAAFPSLELELKPLMTSGNSVGFLKADVSRRYDIAQAVTHIVRESGGIDIFVVNAGILPMTKLIEELPEEEWEKSLKINLTGAFHGVAEVLKWMKSQNNGGDIIFIASKNVPAPGPQAVAYSVAKAGQTQLARVCALEAGPHGIRVNMLHPHLIFDTGLWNEQIIEKRAKAYGMTPEQYKRNNLLNTELTSSDVAEATFALVAGYFSKTTGAQISIDGGSERTI